ncbi:MULTISPECIES: TAXI family TRAP transporter solute-binding subunit [Hoeflea]|uniref:TAXI family TRAP transporter solute-binding subunit n=1 Tax=Hoeflea alexandrii TaxID=288436 RepID=A0ABT1CN96_9HYPH|nr:MULTISPECIES: TAXI family TRAP transporter solute-binding subunit [Hoeflea]MCO6407664.1 TAXI family TRAP transporter solute-binding subunit [Hoeflea alexandrii]VVT09331.1 TRAP transporter solute receptor, TAXI family [Hoeflea sp. EC-HK425]
MKKLTLLAAGAFLALSATAPLAQDAKDYVLNTASTGGTYHPVGTAISTLTKVKLLPKENFSLTAVNSAGSGANVQAMGAGTADFAILQGLFGSYAATGTGPITEPQENLRSVTMLWQNVEQFVIAADKAKTGTVSDLVDLKGMSAGMGSQNSGTIGSNRVLLSGLGIDIDTDFELVYAGYGPTTDAMANGQVVAAGIPSGPPTGAITKLMASNEGKFTVLDVSDEELAKMDGGRNLWVPYTIAAGTYPGQEKDINTIAQPNFLAVNASVDENHVYLLTKTMYENLGFLTAIHPATKVMAVEKAMAGLPVKLHPGAARFYKEAGLEIPAHLMP